MKFFRLIFTLSLPFLFLFVLSGNVEAKVLPQAKKAIVAGKTRPSGSGITVFPKLRGDRKALLITFGNLQNATSVSYTLTYTANGQSEGAGGSLTLDGSQTATRELLFGTCSKNVCRYHTNIRDAKLEVSYTTTQGKKYLKRYRIKI